jgi:hypothetical protein
VCSEYVDEEEFFAETTQKKSHSKRKGDYKPRKHRTSSTERTHHQTPKMISMEVTEANGFTYTLRRKIRFQFSHSPSFSLNFFVSFMT